jgi:hypothetical protein
MAAQSEALPIRCEQAETEKFTARFALRLASAVPGRLAGAEVAAYDNFVLEHALACLEPGQQLCFAFHGRGPHGTASRVTFEVRGQAREGTYEQAEASCRALCDATTRLLAARSDCQFISLQSGEASMPYRYRTEVQGILLTPQAKPAALEQAIMPVIVPELSLVEARVPLWEALLACPFAVDLFAIFEPVHLTHAQLAAVAETLRLLGDARLRHERFPGRQPLALAQARALAAWMGQGLERWLELGSGVRLHVAMTTAEPVASGALRWLAQTLLPSRRLAVRPDDAVTCPPVAALDLRSCLNQAKVMPALLPDRRTVQRLGLPVSFPSPESPLAATGIVLGVAGTKPVRLPAADRERHCYIVGATGCGKSTLLRNLILQDLEAGEGLCLVDPHGDLFRDVLQSVPRRRAKDVLLIDPTDVERSVGLNYLEIPGSHPALERNFIANELIKIFDRLYDLRVVGGPMFESYARAALLLLMESRIPGLTLVELPLIFESERYRKWLVSNCTNPTVARFWSQQAERATGETSLANISVYVTSKFNQFTSNVLVRNIVGQSRSMIDLRAAMDGRKIVLVNLSKGLLGEFDSALLGMLLVSKLFVAALGRARMPREARRPLNLYIDEFQNFTTDTVAHLLSEARKFGLRLTLAHQHLTQIDVGRGAGNLSAAVLANVGSVLAMRLSANDAEVLKDVIGQELPSRTLQNLPDFHVAGRLMQEGRPMRPFVFRTLPPEERPVCKEGQKIVRRAYLEHYTREVAQIEREIEVRAALADSA